MNRRTKRFVPRVLGLEDRIALSDAVANSGEAVSPDTGDYSITMEPEPYTYSAWYDAFANLLENLDEAFAYYVSPPDNTYIDDAYASPYYVQP